MLVPMMASNKMYPILAGDRKDKVFEHVSGLQGFRDWALRFFVPGCLLNPKKMRFRLHHNEDPSYITEGTGIP